MTAPLESDGLILTIAVDDDIDDLLTLPSAEPFLNHWTKREEVEVWIRGQRFDVSADHLCLRWVIRDAATGAFVGWFEVSTGIDECPDRQRCTPARLEINRLPDAPHRSVTSKAVDAIAPLMRDLNVKWLLGKIRSDNAASLKAVADAGFEKDENRVGLFGKPFGQPVGYVECFYWRRVD